MSWSSYPGDEERKAEMRKLRSDIDDLSVANEALEAELAELRARHAELQREAAGYATEMTRISDTLFVIKESFHE